MTYQPIFLKCFLLGVSNDGYDNESNDYILRVNDVVFSYNHKDKSIKEE